MKLRAPGKRIVLPAMRPNAGMEAYYRTRLLKLIERMHADVLESISKAYKAKPPHLAQDMSPAMAMRKQMRELGRKWTQNFSDVGKEIAQGFASGVLKNHDAAYAGLLRKAGFSVKFQMGREANDVYQSLIGENVGLIKSIPQKYLADVEGEVMRSVQKGRDLKGLEEAIVEKFQATKGRARLIARDQNNKASAIINRVRQRALGIKKAIWRHSGGGVNPRPEHEAADGEEYDIDEGLPIGDDGEFVFPGEAINCRCVSMSVIPGMDEDEGEGGESAEAA